MPGKYDALTSYLAAQPPDEDVVIELDALGAMIGGLPPSSSGPTWWANTAGHSQAQAWLVTGRRVRRLGTTIIFTPASTSTMPAQPRPTFRATQILDGVAGLDDVLRRAGYSSIVAAVAEHTVFLDPTTVQQSGGHPIFPVVRDMHRRGDFDTLADGREVLLDDNTTPTLVFLWAANRGKGRDVQYNHLWTDSKNPALYTALWNLCACPAFLAKTTDGQNHPEVRAALQYRAFDLYGMYPAGHRPSKPHGYDDLARAPMPDRIADLERVLRARLASSAKSPPAVAARTLGWLFSDWHPDPALGGDGLPLNRTEL
jgi:hypothetical protein